MRRQGENCTKDENSGIHVIRLLSRQLHLLTKLVAILGVIRRQGAHLIGTEDWY